MAHPIERLRHVARAAGADPALLAREAASALSAFDDDPAGLVTACRRLIERHTTAGPLWWLAARVLVSGDPTAAAQDAARALYDDPTPRQVASDLPQDATVVVVGWPDIAADALGRRADLEVLVVDSGGYARAFTERLQDRGTVAVPVPQGGAAVATVNADLVLLEATAAGPTGILAALGSHAAAAVAASAGVPVWAVVGTGRALPARLWDALLGRLDATPVEPWDRDEEVVPAALVHAVLGPKGLTTLDLAVAGADCPVAPELLKGA